MENTKLHEIIMDVERYQFFVEEAVKDLMKSDTPENQRALLKIKQLLQQAYTVYEEV